MNKTTINPYQKENQYPYPRASLFASAVDTNWLRADPNTIINPTANMMIDKIRVNNSPLISTAKTPPNTALGSLPVPGKYCRDNQ